MKQENINKLHQVRQMMGERDMSEGIQLINSVLLDENGVGAVLNPHSNNLKEPVIVVECQACFTIFKESDQKGTARIYHLCPSCDSADIKIVYPKLQEQITAVLEA